MYSSPLSLTSAVDGVGGQRHASSTLPSGKTRYAPYRRLGWTQGKFGQVRKSRPPPGFDPRTVQPVASRYTDRAIAAHPAALHRRKNSGTLWLGPRAGPDGYGETLI